MFKKKTEPIRSLKEEPSVLCPETIKDMDEVLRILKDLESQLKNIEFQLKPVHVDE